jgi:hypothetical protein
MTNIKSHAKLQRIIQSAKFFPLFLLFSIKSCTFAPEKYNFETSTLGA